MVPRVAAIVAAVVAASATPAAADTRFRLGMDVGGVYSLPDDGRTDGLGVAAIVVAGVIPYRPGWNVVVGLGIPMAPMSVQLPIIAERAPILRGPIVRFGLRPTAGLVALCVSDPDPCPRNQMEMDPYARGGWAIGVLGEVGVGYRWPIRAQTLDVRLGYLAGGFFARGGEQERPRGGLWQGVVLGLDVTF